MATMSERAREREQADGGEEGRLSRLRGELAGLASYPTPAKSPNLLFRADGRSPWTIRMQGGFSHFQGGNIGLVRSGIRSFALQQNLRGWLSKYRLQKKNEGMPTISSGEMPDDASGASNARWQYAISFDLTEYSLTAETLGIDDYPPEKVVYDDHLWMNAPTLEAATEVVISGGPLNEYTFLTPIGLDRIVAYVLLTDGPKYLLGVWRPFNSGDLSAYQDVLMRYGEFNFKE
jgi:hypothetical protein